jgi:Ca2+-binding RTX toxin-like protein
VLDGTVHASSGPSGAFAAGDARFWSSGTGTAHDGDDRVIYNSSNGQLWYDADGNGAGARQLIATLEGIPALTASDITIINGSGTGGGGGGGSVINGTSGNDTLTGTAGNDTINGFGGNDLFVAGSTGGADVIDGGTGTDSIEFRDRATSGVVVDFRAGTITGGSSGTISFTAVERVVASNFADSLTGAAGGQTLTGQGGADTLWGGAGVDTLWGAGGNDAFVFREMGSANADRVSDFASGADKLQLDDAAFTSIGAMGNFAAGDARFWASSSGAAHDSNDRVLYNTSTGQLYYDADGNGSAAAQLIATVLNAPAVAATDIVVI